MSTPQRDQGGARPGVGLKSMCPRLTTERVSRRVHERVYEGSALARLGADKFMIESGRHTGTVAAIMWSSARHRRSTVIPQAPSRQPDPHWQRHPSLFISCFLRLVHRPDQVKAPRIDSRHERDFMKLEMALEQIRLPMPVRRCLGWSIACCAIC